MLGEIKAVLFDMDGTLIDSMWMWKQIDIEYLGKYGYDLPDDLQKAIEGMSFSETADYFKERFQIPDSTEDMKKEWNQMAWDKYEHEVTLKDGVLDFLKQCKKSKIPMGIGTSNSKELAMVCLEALGVLEYFDSIRTSCEVAAGKPAPDIYQLVADDLKVPYQDCIVFEDMVSGIQAGVRAGMKTCAVRDVSCYDCENEKRELADYYIDSFEELLEE